MFSTVNHFHLNQAGLPYSTQKWLLSDFQNPFKIKIIIAYFNFKSQPPQKKQKKKNRL